MSITKRLSEVLAAAPAVNGWKTSSNLGNSNATRLLPGALLVVSANLTGVTAASNHSGIRVASAVVLPSDDQVYLVADLSSDMDQIARWLDSMVGGNHGRGFSGDNDNCPVVLVPDSRAYIHNRLGTVYKGLEFVLPEELPSFNVDRLSYAVYPPSPTGRRSLAVSEFIGFLSRLVGSAKIHEIVPWTNLDEIGPDMRRLPASIPFEQIKDAVYRLGYFDPGDLLLRYHQALNYLDRKHFVILTGLSGTGKTLLSLRYAQAVHGISNQYQTDPLFFSCPVRPDWTDPTGLLGYYDMISNRYVVPPFLDAVLAAHRYGQSPIFALLDELNLARVEYYLADVLSAMETAQSAGEAGQLHLHSSSVPLEGSNGTEIPRSLALPANLYIVGTVNVDETTHPISSKVLDRAVVIDTTDVNLQPFFDRLKVRYFELVPAIDACSAVLVACQLALAPHGLGFGYRVAEEFVRYFRFAAEIGCQSAADIIDDQMVQKVLVKLRGTHAQEAMLWTLSKQFQGDYPDFLAVIKRLQGDLTEFHSFQNSR